MLIKLILLFTIIPLAELTILIKIGSIIGVISTIFIVVATGILGAALARNQGVSTLNKTIYELNHGRLPTENLISGFLILAGGIVLLTPGLITDLLGLLLLIPTSREVLKKILKNKLRDHVKKNVRYTTITINRNE